MMAASVAGFTGNTLLLKHLGTSREVPALLPLLFRAAVGIGIVFLFFRGRRPTRLRPVFTEGRLVSRGLTGLLGTAAYYWTVPPLGAGKATLFCNTYVVFAALIAAVWLGEALTVRRVAWLTLAFAGIVLLSGSGRDAATFLAFGPNEGIALLGAILAAVSVILIRQLSARHSIGTIYLAQCVWILLPVLPFTVADLGGLAPRDVGLLVLAAIAAGYGQLAMNEGYRCLAVSTGAALQMLWPVFTTLGGILLFGERFGLLQGIGAAAILTATWFIATRRA
jgi:drug/metabolite transporter (DMT)-like permease